MSSNLVKGSVKAWFLKEWRCEMRSKQGVLASGLFGFMAVVVASFSTMQERYSPWMASAFLCLALVFASVVTVPRLFLSEEDQGTFDLARTMGDEAAVFMGKLLFSLVLAAGFGVILGGLFVVMTKTEVARWDVLIGGSVAFSVGLATVLAIGSAMVIGAVNRYVLAGVVAMPLTLPLVFLGVGVLRFAFGEGSERAALQNFVMIVGYEAGLIAMGPILVKAIWGVGRSGSGGD